MDVTTQACLLGLVRKRPLDGTCPNASAHRDHGAGNHHTFEAQILCETYATSTRRRPRQWMWAAWKARCSWCSVQIDSGIVWVHFHNKKSIRFIGFHDVEIRALNRLDNNTPLSSSMLCRMLGGPRPTLCRAADCVCLLWRKEGWRLVVGDDRPKVTYWEADLNQT